MNYIDIIIIVVFALFTYAGYRKGIFLTLIELVRYVVGLPICFFVSNSFAQPVYESLVRPRALESISNQIADATSKNEMISSINEAVASLPDFVSGMIDTSALTIKKTDVAEQILTKVFEPVLLSLTKGALFMIAFVLFFGITGIVLVIFNKARKAKEDRRGKSALSKTDHAVGAVFGICKSFVTIVALSAVIMYIQGISPNNDNSFFQQVEASRLLAIFNSINPFNLR